MNIVSSCPVCAGNRISEFFRRNSVPVHQHLLFESSQDALKVARGDLALTVCHECGFIFNRLFDEKKLAYGSDYDNTQSHSPFFARYLADLANHLIYEDGVRNSHIIEVGCGKGVFLRHLVGEPISGNYGIGFDPSYVGPESDMDGRLRFERRFYDEACADMMTDVVVCRHVIEHVSRPMELLQAIRRALSKARSPRIFFETPCVEWILCNQVLWDFFYEHCSLFTVSSLRTAFERAGFAVQSVQHVFGEQYIWLEESLASEQSDGFFADAGNIPMLSQQFAVAEKQLRLGWCSRIERLTDAGKIAVWGAGAKGTTFAHLVDPEAKLIDCLIDLNPNKQGRFVSGTGHPIVGVEALASRGVRTAILMNPNYREENEALLAAAGITIQLIE